MRLVGMLMGSLRVLFCSICMLFAFGMIALAVMLSGGPMSLRCVFVVLCSLIVLVSCHVGFLIFRSQQSTIPPQLKWFPVSIATSQNVYAIDEVKWAIFAPTDPKDNEMSNRMPPIPPGNQSPKVPKSEAGAERDTSKHKKDIQNSAEQGEAANIRQNTTNAGFFKGRRVK